MKNTCPFDMAYMLTEGIWFKCPSCGYREPVQMTEEERKAHREQAKLAEREFGQNGHAKRTH